MPESLLLPGIFLAACFISLSIGTSVGTIAALTPVAVGIANSTNIETAFIVAIVVGGSFFGDNLSFISDTTIVATQTQKCKMNDKFKVNIRIIAPMVILVLIAYYFMSREINAQTDIPEADLLKIIPYIVVIITAVCGINVLMVLSIGLLLTGCIGIIDGSYDVCSWFVSLGNGMANMTELIIMTLLASGMLALVRHNGGISFIISTFIRNINSKRNAEFCIAALTCLINICTANNTVAIITTGPIAADISERFGIDRRKSASILDTVSCFTQGLLPYGAQILIAAGLANIAPVTIIPHLYYPMAIGLGIVLSIIFRYPKKYS
jgi:Na+/H+ antiporter NhaC